MPKRIFLVLLTLSLLAGSVGISIALAQEQAESQQVSQGSAPAFVPAPLKLVTAIEVKGNKAISTNVVISKMKTKVGSPYQENIASDDLKRLYLLGFFSDIKIDTEDYNDGVKIIVTVKERPIIDKITFSGIVHLTVSEIKIKEALKSKEGQYLDYPNLAEDIRIIKKMYEKIGFSAVQIDHAVDVDNDTQRAKVQFNIIEGKKVRVKNIFIEGNTIFSDQKILRLMKTKEAWFFNAGVLKEDVLAEDIERIKSFYKKEGFIDVTAESQVKPQALKPFLLDITIKIKEGKRYLVGNVTINGTKDITQKEVLSKLKDCIPGKVFSQEALKKDIMNIQGLYFDRGYISVQVQEATSLNTYTGRIDVVYNIAENQITYVDKIKVRGNVKTKDMVIRRELRIRPGDRFDGEKLKRSKERLQNLGFFEEVSYDTEEGSAPDKKNLLVDVKESKTGAFSFGGGYSTVDQFVGFVEVEQKNFDWKNWPYFTGGGQNLKLRTSFGTSTGGIDFNFTEPWLFDYPISLGIDAYKTTHDKDSDSGYGYKEKILGGDVSLGKELTEYIKADITYRWNQIKISDVDTTATSALLNEVGTNVVSSTTFSASFDNRDSVFDTTKGNFLTGSIECAGGPFGGDKNYAKFNSRVSHYVPLWNASALEFRGRVGVVNQYGDSNEVPIYERFFAGGASTIRGYNERKIGPIDPITKDALGGNSMMIGNIEYLYPVLSFAKAAVFYDVGNVWEKVDKIGSGGFKSGVGFGVRLKTPIGPIMLDYGIPLNKEPGEDSKGGGRFHFNVSHGF
ncbi:MAG: outer membrane protein assembly factor BamA [Candidatus Omnitrophica bacterium]|nr:outer membrane protein assembly factor BamA [Candidatus Omnitrophota bacterium]